MLLNHNRLLKYLTSHQPSPKNRKISASLLCLLAFKSYGTVSYDYDGDGKADIAVRRATNFTQYVSNSSNEAIQQLEFGKNETDIPISGDFDGDGIADVAVRRPSTQFWYIKNSSGQDLITGHSDGITRLRFGLDSADIPVPADFDGDGITDIAVRRASNQFWYVRNSSGVDSVSGYEDGITRIRFGLNSNDIPVVADYDGDGKADFAVRRATNQYWYILNSSGLDELTGHQDGITRKRFGLREEDIPVTGDFDGDGKADLAVRRPSTQYWYVLNSSRGNYNSSRGDGIQRIDFGGQSKDIPIAADYDGDGKHDVAVRRASNQIQYILHSSVGETFETVFGEVFSDIPLAAPVLTRMAMVADTTIDPNQPVADMLFPAKVAGVEGADSIWVRGIANATNGVSQVTVNGVPAQLETLRSNETEAIDNDKLHSTNDTQTVSWAVEVPYSSDVVVSVTDSEGMVNRNASNSSLDSPTVPDTFTIDDTNHRLYGVKWGTENLISIDLETDTKEIIKSTSGGLDANQIIYASVINKIIAAKYTQTGPITLSTIDPETAIQSPLTTYEVPKTSGDWYYYRLEDLAYAAPENSLYIHVNMHYQDRKSLSHIAKYDITAGEFIEIIDGTYTSEYPIYGPGIYSGDFYADNVVWIDNELFFNENLNLPEYTIPNGIQRLNLDTNEKFYVTNYYPTLMTTDSSNPDHVFTLKWREGFGKLDISRQEGNLNLFSPEASETNLNFTQPTHLDHDATNGRLMLYDWMINMIMAIDIETGKRSRFIHDGIGTGKTLYNPEKMALDEDQGILYVADDGENAPESIVAINLSTGHRTTIGNINQRYNVWIEDLVLDKANNSLYVVFEETILAVNTVDGNTRTVLDANNNGFASGTSMRGAVLDPVRNRLLVTVSGTLSLYSVDLSDGTVSLVAEGEEVKETAGEYYISRDITLTNENSLAMLSIVEGNASLIYTNLKDGSQDTIAGVCSTLPAFTNELTSSSIDIFYHKQGVVHLSYPISKDTLILKSNQKLFSYDVTDGECSQIWNGGEHDLFYGLHDVISSSLGQWYITHFSAVYQLDLESGQTVVLGR